MMTLEWLKPGVKLKRWIVLLAASLFIFCMGICASLTWFRDDYKWVAVLIICLIVSVPMGYYAMKRIVWSFVDVISINCATLSFDSDKLSSMLYERRLQINGPKIVAVGGGTGLSTMLRGLKKYSSNLTALVTVADDGGGSGVLREDLGILPPGDIRNCILALADTEPIMQNLLNYRFHDGMLKGQSFGNLFLAAMDGISDSFEVAVQKMSDVLAVTGRVLPITLEDVRLCAQTKDGKTIFGEYNIGHRDNYESPIDKVFFNQQSVKPLDEAIAAINEADIIVLGPGSLYTSIIPNLLVDGVCDALRNTSAIIVYVCNVMTQPCETEHYKLSDHIRAIEKHAGAGIIDYCIVNTANIPDELSQRYNKDGAEMVKVDAKEVENMGIKLVTGDFKAINANYIRHDSAKLARKIIEMVSELVLAKDKKRALDYYYAIDRLNSADKHDG